MPIKYVDQHAHGDLMSRMTNDVENISDTISQSLSSLVAGILTIIGTGCDDVQLKLAADIAFRTTVLLTVLVTKSWLAGCAVFIVKNKFCWGVSTRRLRSMSSAIRTVVAYNRQPQIVEDFSLTADSQI